MKVDTVCVSPQNGCVMGQRTVKTEVMRLKTAHLLKHQAASPTNSDVAMASVCPRRPSVMENKIVEMAVMRVAAHQVWWHVLIQLCCVTEINLKRL